MRLKTPMERKEMARTGFKAVIHVAIPLTQFDALL